MPKNYFKAIAVLIGYVIGVGMFGLPFLVSRAGLLSFFVFIILLGLAQYLLHLIYANVIIATKPYHRLPGYAAIYLGRKGKIIVFISKMIGNYGALLAYIIITGIFLNQLLSPIFGGSEFFYASLLFAIEAAIVFFGIGMIARAELMMSGLLLLVVILIAWKGWGAINISNYNVVTWQNFLLPYGAMLFALDGGGSLPIVAKLLKKDKDSIKSVIRMGTIISILVITMFTLVIVGISGSQTSPDALSGVGLILNDGVIFFALIFGVLTMVTSFFGVAQSVKEALWWDFKINKYAAWALAVFIPYGLYLVGLKNLIGVISIAGGVAGGLSAIILILIFRKMSKMKNKLLLFKRPPGRAIIYFLIGLFICGIIYEAYYFLIK
ncbi:MAG: aromatic amino acid transport family protein [Patescibacteria group bacterium]